MREQYIFYISAGAAARRVFPMYGELSKKWAHEDGGMYFRETLDGKLTFARDDYDFIMSSQFDSEFFVDIYRSGQDAPYFSGMFVMTDCEIDHDNRLLSVELQARDAYSRIMEGLENTYDILRLPVAVNRMSYDRRPILQIYIPGDEVVTSLVGGTWWETPCTPVTDTDDIVDKYHFSNPRSVRVAVAEVSGSGVPDVSGRYSGALDYPANGPTFMGTLTGDGDYRIRLRYDSSMHTVIVEIIDASDTVYFSDAQGATDPDDALGKTYECTALSAAGASGSVSVSFIEVYVPYSRYLCDIDSINRIATVPVPEEDIIEDTDNYSRIAEYPYLGASMSYRTSETPTEWGEAPDGTYYLPPNDSGRYYPVARSMWKEFSVWVSFPDSEDAATYEERARKRVLLRNAYPLPSVISVLLAQYAEGITHDGTPEYSEFLYSEGSRYMLYLTPKSNIVVGDYDQAAQKAETTLKEVLDMLANVLQVYWFIDGSGRLRLEHVSWFRNGGSYSGAPRVGTDLTQMYEPRSGKAWAYGQNRCTFDKADMAQRYEFSWMDDVSPAFEGYPAEMLSPYVEKGKVEDIQAGQFTSDIDFMGVNAQDISKDGFALLAPEPGQNLAQTFTAGLRLDPETGDTVQDAGYATSSYMAASPGDYVVTGAPDGITVCWYNMRATNNFISSVSPLEKGREVSVKAPAGTYYMRLTVRASASGTAAVYEGPSRLRLPYLKMEAGGYSYNMQNGYLSYLHLVPALWSWSFPAGRARINGTATRLEHTTRKRMQEVSFPAGEDPDTTLLIRTGIGDGQIDEMTIDLNTRIAEITLAYDTEPKQ